MYRYRYDENMRIVSHIPHIDAVETIAWTAFGGSRNDWFVPTRYTDMPIAWLNELFNGDNLLKNLDEVYIKGNE